MSLALGAEPASDALQSLVSVKQNNANSVEVPSLNQIEAAGRLLATAKSFQNIAQFDFSSAISARGSDAFKKRWSQERIALFDSRIDSAAFFAHAIIFLGPFSDETGHVGIYNIWVDAILVMRFDTKERQRLAYDFAIVKGGSYDKQMELPVISSDLTVTSLELKKRLKTAEHKFYSLFASNGALNATNDSKVISDIKARLQARIAETRRWLDPESDEYVHTKYAKILEQIVELIRSIKHDKKRGLTNNNDLGRFAPLLELPLQWRQELQLVMFSGNENSCLAVFAAFSLPECLLLVDIENAEGTFFIKNVMLFQLDEKPTKQTVQNKFNGRGQ